MLKRYLIWFSDGSVIIRDAENEKDAREQGTRYLDSIEHQNISVNRAECLS